MNEIIANSFRSCNSYSHIPEKVAYSYSFDMRGTEKRANRAARLRRLNKLHTYEEMARKMGGKTSPAYLSQIANEVVQKRGKNPRGLSDDYATRLESAFNLQPGWFDIPDTGEARESPPREYGNTEPGPDVRGFVPLIDWVAAGEWQQIADPYEVGDAEQWVPCPVSHGHRTFVLRVRGESMEPEYLDGDWIFVDPDRQPDNGSHVVVRLEDEAEATFKKLVIEGDHRYLVALNPAWPSRVIEVNGNANIVGVVVFSGKPRV